MLISRGSGAAACAEEEEVWGWEGVKKARTFKATFLVITVPASYELANTSGHQGDPVESV